jgi:hypothetical protein
LTWFWVEILVFIVCDKLLCIGLVMGRAGSFSRLFLRNKPWVPEIISSALAATTTLKIWI